MNAATFYDIVVIYVSWNTRDELAASLEALAAAEGLEVVVVDNASSDRTVAMLRERFPDVRVIVNPDNLGFAAAFNQGWRASERPFVLQMNPDTILPPEELEAMRRCLGEDASLAAIAPLLVDEDGADTDNARPFPPLTLRSEGDSLPPHGESLQLEECRPGSILVHWFMGACGLFRREALVGTGGFDEGFFLYGEDIDWCLRAWRSGWRLVQARGISAVHLGNRSAAQVPSWTSVMRRHDGYFRYLAQAHGPWAARGNYLWWLARAGIATLVLAPASLVRPSLRPRLWHEWGRVRYCLTHLGWPFLCCSFGRNDAPRRETKG